MELRETMLCVVSVPIDNPAPVCHPSLNPENACVFGVPRSEPTDITRPPRYIDITKKASP